MKRGNTDYPTTLVVLSEAEEREALEQIERAISAHRPSEDRRIPFRPKKRGALFPVLVNLGAALVVAGTIVLARRYFEVRQQSLVLEGSSYLASEQAVIEELKREAARRMQEKDVEIRRIEDRLAMIDQERQRLATRLEDAVAGRRQELLKELEDQLARERSRLEAQGLSAADVGARVSALEEQARLEQTRQLAAYARETEARLADTEKNLLAERRQAENLLSAARREGERLVAEAERQQELARRELEVERTALTAQKREAEQKLQELQRQASTEALVTTQIVSSYAAVQSRIERSDYAGAAAELRRLRDLMLDGGVDAAPEASRRRDTELFVINALLELIDLKAAPKPPVSTEQMMSVLLSVRDALIQAEELQKAGRGREAAGLYYRIVDDLFALDEKRDRIALEAVARSRGTDTRALLAAIVRYQELAKRMRGQPASVVSAGLQIIGQSVERLAEVQNLEEEVRRLAEPRLEAIEKSRKEAVLEPTTLIGALSRVELDRLIVEPLVDVRPAPGTRLVIRRALANGERVAVAEATVSLATATAIFAVVDRTHLEGGPRPADLAYLAVERQGP